MPTQLAPKANPDPVLAALAQSATHGPAPRRASASVHNVVQVWTREDNNLYAGQQITSWRDSHGAGSILTLTLPPSQGFTAAMPGRIRFDNATSTTQTFGPGQMPHHTQWPVTLAADPQEMMRQLEQIWPIDTPADLLRALRAAHTRYVITREVRAAELTLLATTDGVSIRAGDIPTHTQHNTAMPGLIITAEDAAGHVTLLLDPSTGFLHAATEYTGRAGRGRLTSYLVYLESDERKPPARAASHAPHHGHNNERPRCCRGHRIVHIGQQPPGTANPIRGVHGSRGRLDSFSPSTFQGRR